MSNARNTFQDLRTIAGKGLDATEPSVRWASVETRITRYRRRRTVSTSAAAVAMVTAVAAGVVLGPDRTDTGPANPPSEAPSPPPVETDAAALDPACSSVTVVPGKAVEPPAGMAHEFPGSFGGLEGWFNATPSAPCEQWDERILEHPDTVLINTMDYTMVEAYYRTSRDALGVYATLDGNFALPEPDPTWPTGELVLIDASTGEPIEVYNPPWPTPQLDALFDGRGMQERLAEPFAEELLPDGYRYIGPADADRNDDDLVEARLYGVPLGGVEDGDVEDSTTVVVRLAPPSSDTTAQWRLPEFTSAFDHEDFADFDFVDIEGEEGAYTVRIHVADEAELILTGPTLDTIDAFVNAAITYQEG